MRNSKKLILAAVVAIVSGCGTRAPISTMATVAAPRPAVRLASVQATSLMVTRLRETGANLIGSFSVANGSRSVEVFRFFGTSKGITQVTVQLGNETPRAVTPAEASRYLQVLSAAPANQQTQQLLSLLNTWSRKTAVR